MGTCRGDYDVWSRRIEMLLAKLGRASAASGFEAGGIWSPPTDVFETDEAVVVKMELPGVGADEVGIVLVDNHLLVRGRRSDPDEGTRTHYRQMEIAYGRFAKIVYLRCGYDRDGITAALTDGFLSLTIPKDTKPAPERVAVEIRL